MGVSVSWWSLTIMEHFGNLFGSLALGGRRLRIRPLDQEQDVEAPPEPDRQQGLSGHVPSPLISTDQRVRAMIIGGAPAWSRRLKQIDTLTDDALAQLEAAWRELAKARRGRPDRFAAEWREHAAGVDFSLVNDLVARHNLYFPTEARLPMSVHTRDYIGHDGRDYRLRPRDAAWVLERLPADLSSALE